jgi:hypothetical protein
MLANFARRRRLIKIRPKKETPNHRSRNAFSNH